MNENELFNEAMGKIDELVEEVFRICDEVADENHYEKEWVLKMFREKFNKAKRKTYSGK